MFILHVSEDTNQVFNFTSQYRTTINIKFPDDSLVDKDKYVPVMDIYIDGFSPIYGIPMIPYSDVLSEYVKARCIPLDYGGIITIPTREGVINKESIVNQDALLVYLTPQEILMMSIDFEI